MKLYVTRHGETQFNIEKRICGRNDVELTPNGILQAEELGERVRELGIDLIVVSPLARALKTAQIVSEIIGVSYVVDERLAERDYGTIDGTKEDAPGFMEDWVQFGYIYPKGESLLRVVQRVYNCIEDLKKENDDKTVMIISHGGICRTINSYFNSLNNEDFFRFNLGNCEIREYDM